MKLIPLLFCLNILGFSCALQAQYWEIEGMAGVTLYHGDLAPDFSVQPPGIAVNFFVRRNVDSRLSIRIGASFGTISANDSKSINPYQKARNLSFKSTVFEGSLALEFNFFPSPQ